jgi:hypothetical protein
MRLRRSFLHACLLSSTTSPEYVVVTSHAVRFIAQLDSIVKGQVTDRSCGVRMFHPVPRVDRWEPVIVGTVLVVLVGGIIATTWFR